MTIEPILDDSHCDERRQVLASSEFIFWMLTWVGAAAAGGVFGFLAAGSGGLILGAAIAALVGLPVIVSSVVLIWALTLPRFSLVVASVAGACTGALSMAIVPLPLFFLSFPLSILLAGVFGAAGSQMLVRLRFTRSGKKFQEHSSSTANFESRVPSKEKYLRLTVAIVLIAAWTFGLSSVRNKLASNYWPDQEAMVMSGYVQIPAAQQIDALFGPAWHFTANFQDPNVVQWFTEALLGDRYELTMIVDAEVNRSSGKVARIISQPEFILREISSVKSNMISYGQSYKFNTNQWQKVVAASGDFNAIGIRLTPKNPAPGFVEYRKAPRNGIQMKAGDHSECGD